MTKHIETTPDCIVRIDFNEGFDSDSFGEFVTVLLFDINTRQFKTVGGYTCHCEQEIKNAFKIPKASPHQLALAAETYCADVDGLTKAKVGDLVEFKRSRSVENGVPFRVVAFNESCFNGKYRTGETVTIATECGNVDVGAQYKVVRRAMPLWATDTH